MYVFSELSEFLGMTHTEQLFNTLQSLLPHRHSWVSGSLWQSFQILPGWRNHVMLQETQQGLSTVERTTHQEHSPESFYRVKMISSSRSEQLWSSKTKKTTFCQLSLQCLPMMKCVQNVESLQSAQQKQAEWSARKQLVRAVDLTTRVDL